MRLVNIENWKLLPRSIGSMLQEAEKGLKWSAVNQEFRAWRERWVVDCVKCSTIEQCVHLMCELDRITLDAVRFLTIFLLFSHHLNNPRHLQNHL